MPFTIPTIYTAVDKYSLPVSQMTNTVSMFGRQSEIAGMKADQSLSRAADAGQKFKKYALIGATAFFGALVYSGNEAIKFEDRVTDIAKTTGLEGNALKKFSTGILEIGKNTRSSIDDLLTIGEIGGQLGVASDQLLAFTEASNKFNVALGSDYSGVEDAISQVGKLKNLFLETRNLDISTSINKAGSVINELGAQGTATSQNMNDFMLRVGTLSDALKPGITATASLSAFLEESGINAERGSSGFKNLINNAATQLPIYAKAMKMSFKETKALFSTDPVKFAAKFATGFKGMSGDKLAISLANFKLNSNEVRDVVGALSNDTIDAGTGMSRLATLTNLANDAFAKGTSLQQEYDKKNNNSAANIEKAKNSFKTLAITIGTQLLPALNPLIGILSPILSSITGFINNNPKLTQGILLVVGAIATWTYVQGLLNIAMNANPIGLIILGISLLVAAIIWLVNNVQGWGEQWNAIIDWMKSVFKLFYLGLIVTFLSIANFFSNMVDTIVLAWKYGMNLIEQLSDDQFAKDKARIMKEKEMRVSAIRETISEMNKEYSKVKSGPGWKLHMKDNEPTSEDAAPATVPVINPKKEQQNAFSSMIKTEQNSNLEITLKGGNNGLVTKNPSAIPVRTTPALYSSNT